jgi:hypothetical protein
MADLNLWTTLRLLFAHAEGSQEVVAKHPAILSFLDGVTARDRLKSYLARDVYAGKH